MADLGIVPFTFNNAGNMASLGILGGQTGDREDLLIGSEAHTGPFTGYTVVRLIPEADCVIRIGENAIAEVATGDPLTAGIEAMRYVKEGERISVIAA